MNLESIPVKKAPINPVKDDLLMDDFDFKPITSGLGFHQACPAQEIQTQARNSVSIPVVNPIVKTPYPRKENTVYQNDLSLFYGQSISPSAPVLEEKVEKTYRLATKPQRMIAYVIDLILLSSILGFVLNVMAKTINMNLMDIWTTYPNEITPLVVILFVGFYFIYFSIFEKSSTSTLGKNILGLKVVTLNNELQSFSALLFRAFIGLLNFASLGLFAYFDLQNKITSSKVIRND